jgi:hypothetical protein
MCKWGRRGDASSPASIIVMGAGDASFVGVVGGGAYAHSSPSRSAGVAEGMELDDGATAMTNPVADDVSLALPVCH